jgi:hypothetical protein
VKFSLSDTGAVSSTTDFGSTTSSVVWAVVSEILEFSFFSLGLRYFLTKEVLASSIGLGGASADFVS